MIEQVGTSKEVNFEIWKENWPALEMFLRMNTQWNISGMGAVLGLNYVALEVMFRVFKVKDRKKLLEEIQLIERGAMDVIRESQKKE